MGVSRLYVARTAYNAAELFDIDAEQSADVMYLAHIDHAPTKMQRFGHTDWRFADVQFGPLIAAPSGVAAIATVTNDGDGVLGGSSNSHPIANAYVVTAIDDETGQESRASSSATVSNDLTLAGNLNVVTWAAVSGADRYAVYKDDAASGTFGYIGTATNTTFSDKNIAADLSDTPPLGRNPFDTAGNWPSTVTFFEQRLMWGRTRNKINGIWGSQSANFENMDVSRPAKADDAISFALVAQQVNAANQLVPLTDLLVLSSDAVFRVNGGGAQDYITPSNIVTRRQTSRGSSRLNPILIDDVVFSTPAKGSAVRSVGFTFEVDGYKSNNLSIFSPHFFDGFRIVDWAYQQEPLSVIWAVRSDGKLLAFTWQQEQQVWGWTLCETDGDFESVCSVVENGEDRVYFIVRRTVAGVQRRYIERMASPLWQDEAKANFLDSCIRYSGNGLTVLRGLDHLEGKTVEALADGAVVEGLTVFRGAVTLPYPADSVVIGLPYTSLVETLPPLPSSQGSAQGKQQALGDVVVRVHKSRGLEIGATRDGLLHEDFMYEVKERDNELAYDETAPLFTGDYNTNVSASWSNGATVIIRQKHGLPMTVTAVFIDPIVTS